MSKVSILFLGLLAALGSNAQDSTRQLTEVVITATKFPVKQSQTGKVVSVIDKATVQQMGGRTLSEILNTVAGVNVIGANANLGTNQTVSLRGSSAGNVLLLIDGIPVNDPSVITNYFDLNFIHPDQIERIEILKGGQSTLYGSDAVAGVINILTKKNAAKPVSFSEQFSAGSYGTYKASTGISGTLSGLSYNFQHTYITSNGFSAAYDSTHQHNFDKDNYRQHIWSGDVQFAITGKWSANLFGNYSHYNAAIDAAAFTDDKDYSTKNKNSQAGIGLLWKGTGGDLHINYHYNYINRFYLDDSTDRSNPYSYFSRSNYTGRTHYAEIYKNFTWSCWQLLAGADYRYNSTVQDYFSVGSFGPSASPTLKANVYQVSPYTSLIYSNTGFTVETGTRWNKHSVYGNNFTYTFNPSYLINNKIKLFVNASSAFKAPTLFQLYDASIGNVNLQPEKSKSYEGGFELYSSNNLKWRAVGFYRKTKNAIQYITTDPATYAGQYYNAKEQKNYGAETELTYRAGQWNIIGNYTFTKGSVTSVYSESGDHLTNDTTYNSLYRVPVHAASFFAACQFTKKWSASTLIKYMGKRLEPVYASAPKTLDSYYTVDISGGYKVTSFLRLFADFKNITDQTYFDVLGYTTRRFNFTTGLSLQL